MPPRPRPLSDQDLAAWASYVRHVAAFTGRDIPVLPPASQAAPIAQPAATAPRPGGRGRPFSATVVTGQQPPGLDKSTWNRFHSGKLAAARTLDLHGKTAQAAFHSLERFLHAAHAEQVRCVEIITGRGSGEQGGIIRRELPLWLNLPALRHIVLAAAHPHPNNPGSTRLLLRRRQKSG